MAQIIRDYIEDTRKSGYNDAQIKEALLKGGWDKSAVEAELAASRPEPLVGDMPVAPAAPAPSQPTHEPSKAEAQQARTNTLAIVSFIMVFLFAPLGLILGIVALTQISKSKEGGNGLAIAALVIGGVFSILSILMFISMFAYFGVLDSQPLLPERCEFLAGLECLGKEIKSDSVTVTLRQNIGENVKVLSASMPGCTYGPEIAVGATGTFAPISDTEVPLNEMFKIRYNGCANGRTGASFTGAPQFTYARVGSMLQKDAVGTIRGKIE